MNVYSHDRDYKYLDGKHALKSRIDQLGSESDLRSHLVIAHGISDANKSKKQLGREHLLAHTILVFPELRELIGLHELWGKR